MSRDMLRKIKKKLENDRRIILAYIYGSAAREDMREDSDVNLAVFVKNPLKDPLLEADIIPGAGVGIK